MIIAAKSVKLTLNEGNNTYPKFLSCRSSSYLETSLPNLGMHAAVLGYRENVVLSVYLRNRWSLKNKRRKKQQTFSLSSNC